MSSKKFPKMHAVRRKMAEEVAYLLYTSADKDFKKAKTNQIEDWLADGNYFGDESPAELASEWQEYTRASGADAAE